MTESVSGLLRPTRTESGTHPCDLATQRKGTHKLEDGSNLRSTAGD